jgi:hypothetical protein
MHKHAIRRRVTPCRLSGGRLGLPNGTAREHETFPPSCAIACTVGCATEDWDLSSASKRKTTKTNKEWIPPFQFPTSNKAIIFGKTCSRTKKDVEFEFEAIQKGHLVPAVNPGCCETCNRGETVVEGLGLQAPEESLAGGRKTRANRWRNSSKIPSTGYVVSENGSENG